MAQAGYTPISLYYSTTASAQPVAGDLVSGELALNILDEKLYFKNSSGTVKLLASSASTTNVASISFGSTGLTPSTATTGAITVAGTLAVANGGTGITSFCTGVATALGQNVSGTGSIALTTSAVFTTPNLGTPSALTLTNATGLPLSTGVTGTLGISSGGTGQTTALAAYNALSPMTTVGDMTYEGTGPSAVRLPIGTTGQILTVSGGIPSWQNAPASGVTTISFGSTGLTPSTATSGAVSVAGTLAIANGGTGSTSTTYCNLASNVTGTLPATNGGTGQSTYAVGDLLQGGATNTLTKLAAVATGNALISGGVTTASSWGKIGLTTHVSGTLPVANGGTGATTQTAFAVLCGGTTSTGAYQSVASVGTAGQVLTSNGAGALPTFQAAGGASFPAGTRMSFQQTSAPTGWTKDTTAAINNSALRIVTGSVVNGGTVDFTTAFASQTPTGSVSITSVSGSAGATTLTTPQIPSHNHSIPTTAGGPIEPSFPQYFNDGFSTNNSILGNTGGGGSHTHPFSFSSGAGSFSGNAINLAVKYRDFIIASKD